jgi:hypothetical protein
MLIHISDMLVTASEHHDKVTGKSLYKKVCREFFGHHIDYYDMKELISLVHSSFKGGVPPLTILRSLQSQNACCEKKNDGTSSVTALASFINSTTSGSSIDVNNTDTALSTSLLLLLLI